MGEGNYTTQASPLAKSTTSSEVSNSELDDNITKSLADLLSLPSEIPAMGELKTSNGWGQEGSRRTRYNSNAGS